MKVTDKNEKVLIELKYREAEMLFIISSFFTEKGLKWFHNIGEDKLFMNFVKKLTDKMDEYINT